MSSSVLQVALLAALQSIPPAAQSPRVELPPGPEADLAAKLGAGVKPAVLRKLPEKAWEHFGTWRRWSELLSAEAGAQAPDPARCAELASLALAQDRFDDAWRFFAECASSPAIAKALLPRFLPGADGNVLGDGAVLAPALPPSSAGAEGSASSLSQRVERRAMRIEGISVGPAVLAMRVSVEPEGVQIDVEHLSGGAAKLSIAIPRDPRFDFSDEYVDWYRQDRKGIAHELAIQPGDEPHTLYARFEPRTPAWPTLLPERVPGPIESGAIWLEISAGGPESALCRAVAESLSAGPLRLPALVREPKEPRASFTGISVDLTDAELMPRKLAWIAGAVERLSLPRRR